jgi:hypothetical protein
METMAAQGATLEAHTTQIGKNTKDISNAWKVIRTIELRHEREDGAEEVTEKIEERQQKFWDGVKLQFTSRAFIGLFFIFWLNDHYSFTRKIAALWTQFKG